MGLDQWWQIPHPELATEDNSHIEELYTHRKVPALQDFMESIYRERGGTEEFNCVALPIDEEILTRLEEAIDGNGSGLNKKASGFFWGMHDDRDIQEIREAIAIVRAALYRGAHVEYDSWW